VTDLVRLSFRGVGRIERRSGFPPAMTAQLRAMCKVLYGAGRDDILRDLQTGRVTFREVWAFYRKGDWQRIPTAEHAVGFRERFERWFADKPYEYQRSARVARNRVGDVTLGDLRRRLLEYRAECATHKTGAQFNRVCDKVRAFLRDTLTTDHAIYQSLETIEPLPQLVKRPKRPLRPDEARTVANQLGGEAGRIFWVLCCTGMLPKEYFTDGWSVQDGRLHIKGQKRKGRDRIIPLLCEMPDPTIGRYQFGEYMRWANLGVTPKDARDSFALWCRLAGIPEPWTQALLGHGPGNITQGYGWQEAERILNEAETRLVSLLRGAHQGGQGGGIPSEAPNVHLTYGVVEDPKATNTTDPKE
jgi:hypothetical protein